MFLAPVLSWQVAVLKAYRRVLEDDSLQEVLQKRLARVLLEAYVEYSRSKQSPVTLPTLPKELIDDIVQILQALEKTVKSLGQR